MFAALLIAAIIPQPTPVLRDSAERFENNSMYDYEGRLVFVQLIAWEKSGRVFWWRMNKCGALKVERDRVAGGYVLRFDDNGTLREVRARSYDDSFTQHDPEVDDRAILPVASRRLPKGPQ